MECLENIIGLTLNDCGCYDGDKPADFAALNVSASGLYVTDEVDGFPLLDTVYTSIDCGRSDNVFNSLVEARRLAIQSFFIDVQGYFSSGRENAGGFKGDIGLLKYRSARSAFSVPFAGIVIRPKVARGRSFVLQSVQLGLATAETTTVTVTSDNPEFTSVSVDVTNVANKYGKGDFATPVVLDFSEDYTYLVHYDAVGKQPISNVFSCCGYKIKYTPFFKASGFTGSDLQDELDTCCRSSMCSDPYGLVLTGYVACEDTGWLCEPEMYGKSITQIIARTIQWKAAANLIQTVLDSPGISAYTTLKKEALYGKRASKLKAYQNNLEYIAQQLPSGSCLGCRKSIIEVRRASLV